jgi:2-oxoglutarate ferredoxin oxidoreductase subunit delta
MSAFKVHTCCDDAVGEHTHTLPLPRPRPPRGEIHLLPDRCKGCGWCVEFCTQKVLEISEEFNDKGYHPPRVKNKAACVACTLCTLICPDFAIFVVQPADTDPSREARGKQT